MPLEELKKLHQTASAIQAEVASAGFVPMREARVDEDLYAQFVTDTDLRTATERLFQDGHYAQAIEEAYKCFNNIVKDKAGKPKKNGNELDGADLMRNAFSESNPLLKLTSKLSTSTEKNQQNGYRDIFAGCMTGIRNPHAHSHNIRDSKEDSLVLLAWANHLIAKVKKAIRSKSRKTP